MIMNSIFKKALVFALSLLTLPGLLLAQKTKNDLALQPTPVKSLQAKNHFDPIGLPAGYLQGFTCI